MPPDEAELPDFVVAEAELSGEAVFDMLEVEEDGLPTVGDEVCATAAPESKASVAAVTIRVRRMGWLLLRCV
jgi:hypothetical protein